MVNQIQRTSWQAEKLRSDREASEYFIRDFNNFIKREQLTPEQIYNASEIGVYWKMLPSKTLASEQERSDPGHKSSKEQLTVLCCANAAGSHKLKLGVIGKAKKPRLF